MIGRCIPLALALCGFYSDMVFVFGAGCLFSWGSVGVKVFIGRFMVLVVGIVEVFVSIGMWHDKAGIVLEARVRVAQAKTEMRQIDGQYGKSLAWNKGKLQNYVSDVHRWAAGRQARSR